MAEIPVARRGGTPWWMYLLGGLLLLAIVIFAMRGCAAPRTTGIGGVQDGTARISAEGAGSVTRDRVTDANILGSSPDMLALVGREWSYRTLQ